jgi:hypothetical protein
MTWLKGENTQHLLGAMETIGGDYKHTSLAKQLDGHIVRVNLRRNLRRHLQRSLLYRGQILDTMPLQLAWPLNRRVRGLFNRSRR